MALLSILVYVPSKDFSIVTVCPAFTNVQQNEFDCGNKESFLGALIHVRLPDFLRVIEGSRGKVDFKYLESWVDETIKDIAARKDLMQAPIQTDCLALPRER